MVKILRKKIQQSSELLTTACFQTTTARCGEVVGDDMQHIYKSRRYRRLAFWLALRQRFCLRWLLLPCAALYRVLLALRVFCYRQLLPTYTLPAVTISVGNITSGGSGKTPIVIAIGQQLQAAGERVAVLTRGYGSSLRRDEFSVLCGGEVVCGKVAVRNLDEPRLIAHALPQAVVIVAAKRYAALQRYLATVKGEAPTRYVLDDGFQHLRIKRDLDIVLLDAAQPFADGKLLPRGMLREPVTALRRADLVLFTRARLGMPSPQQLAQVQRYAKQTLAVKFRSARLLPSPATAVAFSQQYQPLLLVCGTAAPAAVLMTLQQLAVQVRAAIYLADHEAVERRALQRLSRYAKALVMTAKDYWREREVYDEQPLPVFIVELTAEFDCSAQLDPLSMPS